MSYSMSYVACPGPRGRRVGLGPEHLWPRSLQVLAPRGAVVDVNQNKNQTMFQLIKKASYTKHVIIVEINEELKVLAPRGDQI